MNATKLKNAKRWKPDGVRPIAVCTLGFIVAFALRYMLGPILDESLSMLLFTLNCIFMSYLFGLVYSIALLCVSIPTAMFFFRKPFYMFDALTQRDLFMILLYAGIITLTSIIIEWLQRERYAAVLRQRVSDTRYQLLIESDQGRQAEYMKVRLACTCGVQFALERQP